MPGLFLRMRGKAAANWNDTVKTTKPVKKKYLTPMRFCGRVARVIEMEQIGRRVFLYDFYGELLTDHQKEVYGDVVLNDMSLSEIAEEQGISRQGVHDLIRRCDRILSGYEEKLHLVERFLKTKEDVRLIRELSRHHDPDHTEETLKEIYRISGQILEEL